MSRFAGAAVLPGVVVFGFAYYKDPHMFIQAGFAVAVAVLGALAALTWKIRRSARRKTEVTS